MKNKKSKLYSAKVIIPLSMFFSSIICVSIGFSAWVIPASGMNYNIDGDVDAENFEYSPNPISCIDSITFDGFSFSQGYGFVDDSGAFVNSINFTGKFVLNLSHLKSAVRSCNISDKRISIKATFSGPLLTNFSYGVPSLGGFANTPVSKSTSGSSSTYNINLSDGEFSSSTDTLERTFSVAMTYSGQLSSFPNLAGLTYSISFLPGEYIL